MKKIDAGYEIERLLKFAERKKMIGRLDAIHVKNGLMEIFGVMQPYFGEADEEDYDTPVSILENLLDYAAQNGLLEDNTITYRDLMDARIMGFLMPRQSEMEKTFYGLYTNQSPRAATDWYYEISKASNYIRTARIAKNLYWKVDTGYGDIEITVNLSKPEKDPKAIAAAGKMKQASYPDCLLCLENVGYPGRVNHPARQNHRVIPLVLGNEEWFLQYSPYVYYNEHSIIFNRKHVPMRIDKSTFIKLFDFVGRIPHYFVGSNADLPIVGGSILSHDHFQGGRHRFAMELAPVEKSLVHSEYKGIKAGIVKWPMSVIRISGDNCEELAGLADDILQKWRHYSDEDAGILAYTYNDGEKTPHNTITPIVRKNNTGQYELDLVLRNNRTSDKYPYGIFHPHNNLHHIKKENIGLIEVMGLAVLPGRLNAEMEGIIRILTGKLEYNKNDIAKDDLLSKHTPWIEEMIDNYGVGNTAPQAENILKQEVGRIFVKVLTDAGVYKRTSRGQAAFFKFTGHAGFKEQ